MVVLSALLLLAAACGGSARSDVTTVDPSAACRTDTDCVPAQCCHPTRCVPRAAAPDCAGVACTRHCAPGTLDCGGRCTCRNGACEALLVEAPPLRDVPH